MKKRIKVRLEPSLAKTIERASKEVDKWPNWMKSFLYDDKELKSKTKSKRRPRTKRKFSIRFLRKLHSESLRAIAYDIRHGIMPHLRCAEMLERCADIIDSEYAIS